MAGLCANTTAYFREVEVPDDGKKGLCIIMITFDTLIISLLWVNGNQTYRAPSQSKNWLIQFGGN